MIGALPASQLAPLDYRYALDGALALLGHAPPATRCDQPELAAELGQRLPEGRPAAAALWVEPQLAGWQAALRGLAAGLPPGAPLAIVAAQPLARLLPERRGWAGRPLGLAPGGISRLLWGLRAHGLRVESRYGVHSLGSIARNSLGQLLGRLGRPDLADRLEFASRLRYCARGPAAPLATVALILARKGAGQ